MRSAVSCGSCSCAAAAAHAEASASRVKPREVQAPLLTSAYFPFHTVPHAMVGAGDELGPGVLSVAGA